MVCSETSYLDRIRFRSLFHYGFNRLQVVEMVVCADVFIGNCPDGGRASEGEECAPNQFWPF